MYLNNVPAYQVETDKAPYGYRTGYFWTWEDKIVSGKVVMTNASTRIGKSGQKSFWVESKYVI